jgi:arylsulfatase A-like enzyme
VNAEQTSKRAMREPTLLSHVDFAPTLHSLCAVKVPPDMQGTDPSGVVLGQTDQGPESVFFQIFVPFAGDGTPHPWRGVRTRRYMYACTEAAPWVLYGLEKYPDELTNLAQDPASAAIRKELETRLTKWMKVTGDSWRFNSDVPVEDKGRLYRFQAFYTIAEYIQWAEKHPDLAPTD